jgi:rRNA biogenesis protein RRP5
MKFFFKRYLEFEKKHGDESTVNHVVESARNYVASITKPMETDD